MAKVALEYENINSKLIGKTIVTEAIITDIQAPEPRIDNAVFECKSCMRIHEVKQENKDIHEPIICSECGGRQFKLISAESSFIDTQTITIGNGRTSTQLPLILDGSITSTTKYKLYQRIFVEGELIAVRTHKKFSMAIKVEEITIIY